MAQDITIGLYRNSSNNLQSGYYHGAQWQSGSPPIVNYSSGIFSDGNIITLSGINFSSKTSSQILFTNFSSGSVGQRDSTFHYWAGSGTADYIVDNSVIPPVGSNNVFRAHPIQQTFTEIHYELPYDTDEIFMEAWCRVNLIDFTSSPDSPQVKHFRFVDGIGEASMQDRPLNIALLIDSSGDLQVTSAPVVGNSGWYGSAPANNTWAKYTMYMKKGSLDQNDGERFLHVGSENSFTYSGLPSGHFASPNGTASSSLYQGEGIATNQSTSSDYLFRRVALPYFQRAQQETVIDISQIYINTSKERVVIGNASTWAACDHTKTHCVNIVSRLYDQIKFVAEDGQYPTGALYAYVVNRDGLYNTNGIMVRAA